MPAAVHVRVDLSTALCAGAAAAAAYAAFRFLSHCQWPSAAAAGRHKSECSTTEAAKAAQRARLLQLHYASTSTTASDADADDLAILEVITRPWCCLRSLAYHACRRSSIASMQLQPSASHIRCLAADLAAVLHPFCSSPQADCLAGPAPGAAGICTAGGPRMRAPLCSSAGLHRHASRSYPDY